MVQSAESVTLLISENINRAVRDTCGMWIMPDIYNCKIIANEMLTGTVFSHTVECAGIAGEARAGQFVTVKCGAGRLLRRPVSICKVQNDTFTLVFEVKGEGTRWLSGRTPGSYLDVLGPLGNGFDMPDGGIVVVGGGIGVPPLLFAALSAKSGATAILGFRGAGNVILADEFSESCDRVILTTEDGSRGLRGTVAEPLEGVLGEGGHAAVLACGPRAMLSAVAQIAERHRTACFVSLEERMACGVGACMACACATKADGSAGMSRVCRDGPVFDALEVVW